MGEWIDAWMKDRWMERWMDTSMDGYIDTKLVKLINNFVSA